MGNLGILQKAACAAVWRALSQQNVDLTGQMMTSETPRRKAEVAIAQFVECLPAEFLPKLILPQIAKHGPLPGGYSHRWNDVSVAGRKHDADIVARNQQRCDMSESPWPADSSSSGHSRDASDDGAKAKARPEGASRESSEDTVTRCQ